MKSLHVFNHSVPHTDGYCIRSINILRSQRDVGIEVVAVTSPHHEPPTDNDCDIIEGISFYRTPHRRLSQLPLAHEIHAMQRFSRRIQQVAEMESPNVIHAHSPSTWGIAARKIAARNRLPFVYEVRGIWEDAAVDQGKLTPRSAKYRASRWMETWLAKRADAVVGISQGLLKEFEGRGIEKDRLWYVPNGVDVSKFESVRDASGLRRDLALQGKKVVAYIGSLYPWEGVDDLVNSFDSVSEKVPEAVLLIVGGGPQEDSIRECVRKLGLNDRIRVLGKVPHSEIVEYYSLADLLVYPRKSTRNVEMVTPLKPLEAMAMGKPVLGSNIGGIRELFPHDEACFFVPEDRADLSKSMIRLLIDADQRRRIGQRGRELVLKNRRWESVTAEYLAMYSRLKHPER